MARSRTFALTAALTLAVLPLTACGDQEQRPAGAGASAASQPVAACQAPPEPRSPDQIPTFSTPPPRANAEGKTFEATLATNCGDIVLQLDGTKAPQTVASFKQLAEKGYWESSACHRLTTAGLFVLQCGDPTGTGSGNPGYGFGIENAPADGQFPPGTLAMARAQSPDSNGGQFFIVHEASQLPTQGGGYSIFGKVTKGMDLLKQIAAAGVATGASDGPPAQQISIIKVTVTEKKA